MKILTTNGLTKLIQLIKSSFVDKTDIVTTQEVDIDTTVTSGSSHLITSGAVNTHVKNSTITVTQGGVTKGSFTLNQSSNGTISLDASANADLSNLSTTGKSTASTLAFPSSTFNEITLGTSGTTYTAPANGWYSLRTQGASGGYINMTNNTKLMSCISSYTAHGYGTCLYVKKNDVVQIDYSNAGSVYWFRFYYAEGEV